ncbi:glycosyl hydrolase family 18 protein [Alicyclobacillus fastidiosus]|uniref:glycosyl hydrolase family 18 protein n=1 Tax=Alicyclobacillus fastidiosus TaxID=392011 RepID=UPI0024E13ECC|nr:glycosyl hydrolase family 18 protein [Alicyclobacillus fastidiosus]
MTYFCTFSYQARADGSLEAPKDDVALRAARAQRIRPLVTVTNFDGTNFNPSLAHTILANASIRRRLIDNMASTCKAKGYGGVNVDFEHMQPEDRPLYNQFIAQLRDSLHAQGLSVSIAMGPKTADNPTQSWMGAFDYKTLGSEVDFLMLMTYEWGWVGGPPLAGILQHNSHS